MEREKNRLNSFMVLFIYNMLNNLILRSLQNKSVLTIKNEAEIIKKKNDKAKNLMHLSMCLHFDLIRVLKKNKTTKTKNELHD